MIQKLKLRHNQDKQAFAGRRKQPATSTQDWLPFSDIQSGLMLRRDGRAIGALRVQPINFGLLSEREQKSLIHRYFEVTNGLDCSFQIFSIPRPIDLDGYLAWLKQLREGTEHRIRQRVLSESIREAAEMAASGRAVDRQFYLILPAYKQESAFRSTLELIAGRLSNAGLFSEPIGDAAWRELWLTLMHPLQAAFERAPQKMEDMPFIETLEALGETFAVADRKQGKRKRNNAMEAPAFTTHFLDVVAPIGLKFPPRHVEFGDVLTRTLVIMHYPSAVDRAWLSRIATMPGVILSLHAEPTDSYELTKRMEVAIGELTSKIQTGKPLEKEQAKEKKSALERLFKKLDQEQQRVFFVTVVLMVMANDMQRLDERTRDVESRLSGIGMRGRTAVFFQQEALTSLMPVGQLESPIRRFGQRNMPAESLAASFPFVYSGLNDGRGVMLGMDAGGGIVLCDLWKREASRVNSNGTIIGRPGVGKSSFVKKIMIHAHAQGAKIIVIDPEREYKELCMNLGGDWIDCGGGTAYSRINPLQVRSVPVGDEDEVQGRGPLSMHFQTLRGFFQYYLRQATREHMGLLEIALEDVYRGRGIDWGTTDAELRKLPASSFPHVGHLHAYVDKRAAESTAWNELSLMLRPTAVGADRALWAGETSIRSDSDFVCLDIHQLLEADEGIRRGQFFNVLSYAWNLIEADRCQPVLLFVDEAYLLVDPEVPQALQFLRNTSKRIRKYEGGLWVITHSMVDFLDPSVQRYGQALIDNPTYKLVMGQGEKDLEALTKLMHLSEAEQQLVEKSERGNGLFVAGDQRLHLKVELTELEKSLMGTAGGR